MSSTDKLISLRRTQQDLYQYPTSSKWYMTLSKAISFFELAETSTNALDRFRNFWSALYNLFILYGKVGEDEINRYHFWIKDSINIPEFRTIAQEKNWQKFLADIEKARKILFFDSHRAKWREANQILDSWQKAAEKNIDTNDIKTIQNFFLIIKDIRNAVSHPDFNPGVKNIKSALETTADYLFSFVEMAIKTMIERPVEGTTGKATAYRSFLWPFLKNSDTLFSDYYLEKLFPEKELEDNFPYDIARTKLLPKLVKAYDAQKNSLILADINQTKENWFEAVLADILGINFEKNIRIITQEDVYQVDYAVAKSESVLKTEYASKEAGSEIAALIWVLSWRDDLDSIPSGFETYPMELISNVLSKSDVAWGILTNGCKIRLLSKATAHKARCFLEIDLTAIIDRQQEPASVLAFRYFLGLFSGSSFVELDKQGRTLLDRVQSDSERHGKEISDELKENVYHALAELGDGFLSFLRSNPDKLAFWKQASSSSLSDQAFLNSEQLLTDIYQESLSLMYRMLFLFYAESRDLLPMENEMYRENYSLESIRDEIISVHDDPDKDKQFFAKANTKLWDQLKELFSLVNSGKRLGKESIPAYNGGLFDPEKHLFLEHCKVSDYYLARAIDLLSRTRPKERQSRKKVTYRDLDIRHLGSIYEGILEYFPQLASEELAIKRCKEGSSTYEEFALVSELSEEEKKHLDAYLKAIAEDPEMAKLPRNSKIVGHKKIGQYFLVYGGRTSKRKSSGSYYTPDYIVQYIVENTLGPLVRGECRAKAEVAPEEIASLFPPEDLPSGPLSSDEILQLKVLDPAMGSGHFLVAATEYLARAYSEALKREGKIKNEKMADDEFISYKRRVAERCIYGVDINAMAVELAKLSMWLFTMDKGRPLSFLDHHFKCGNSLIGTKVEDLGGSLFVNYFKGKLPPIIKDIFAIIEKDTITFDDVKAKKAHDQAVENAKLEFKNIADVYVGIRFGEEKSESYLAMLTDPRLARNTSSEFASIYRFFHWQIEFPEVFFNKFGQDLDNAGFDAVIGNPPYVRQEGLGEIKEHFKKSYDAYHGVADLYVYFIEQGINLLNKQGLLGMIISNKWIRAAYGKQLREFLVNNTSILQIVDLSGLPVFQMATVRTIIIVCSRNPKQLDNMSYFPPISIELFNKIGTGKQLQNLLETNLVVIPINKLFLENWSLSNERKQQTIEKLKAISIPLKTYIKGKSLRGLITGLNEAFIIDQDLYNHFIKEDSKNKDILKPLIVGRDIRRYQIEFKNKYLIWTYIGVPIKQYPLIFEHLKQFQSQLEKRWDKGNHWWELRSCEYYNKFEKPKLIYPDIANNCRFALDYNNYFSSNTTYFISGNDIYLLGTLNSKLGYFCFSELCAGLEGKETTYLRFFGQYMDNFPIYPIDFSNPTDKARHDQMVTLVERMLELHKNLATATEKQKPFIQRQIDETDKEIDELVYQLYGLTDEEIAIVEAATR